MGGLPVQGIAERVKKWANRHPRRIGRRCLREDGQHSSLGDFRLVLLRCGIHENGVQAPQDLRNSGAARVGRGIEAGMRCGCGWGSEGMHGESMAGSDDCAANIRPLLERDHDAYVIGPIG